MEMTDELARTILRVKPGATTDELFAALKRARSDEEVRANPEAKVLANAAYNRLIGADKYHKAAQQTAKPKRKPAQTDKANSNHRTQERAKDTAPKKPKKTAPPEPEIRASSSSFTPFSSKQNNDFYQNVSVSSGDVNEETKKTGPTSDPANELDGWELRTEVIYCMDETVESPRKFSHCVNAFHHERNERAFLGMHPLGSLDAPPLTPKELVDRKGFKVIKATSDFRAAASRVLGGPPIAEGMRCLHCNYTGPRYCGCVRLYCGNGTVQEFTCKNCGREYNPETRKFAQPLAQPGTTQPTKRVVVQVPGETKAENDQRMRDNGWVLKDGKWV